MKRLGISIYPEKVGFEKTYDYIKEAANNSFKRIFVNLIEIKDDEKGNKRLQDYSKILNYAKDLGLEVILDVNPNFYKEFKLKPTEIEFFMKMGATGLRFDEDFGGEMEAAVTNNNLNFKLEVNASSGSEIVKKILDHGGNPKNLIACHNFYPLRYTGLDKSRFIELSARYQEMGIKVAAFITMPRDTNNVGPWNINEGMPTIEENRDMSVYEQVIDLLSLEVIDDIIFSQQGDTKYFAEAGKALAEYKKIINEEIFNLRIETNELNSLEEEMIFHNKTNLFNRSDFNSYFIRATLPRIAYKDNEIKERNSGKKLELGDVIILNGKMGRYKGEIHIILKELDDSLEKNRNYVGKISKDDLFKLNFFRHGKKFKFIK